jgi:glycosyltransferase involved in cell wall biosynthesis
MLQKKLSVIIPIYNVELDLERCLRSLEDQDIPKNDYEIICINDGSPDDSRKVVLYLQKEFDNIILIDQKNQGVSCARNNGIEKTNGQYLLFIDPDDYVDTKCFARILENAYRLQAQVSFLPFAFHYENGSIQKVVMYDEYKNRVYKGTEAYYYSRGDSKTDPDRMWAVLFETEFINYNNLRFLPDVPYLEDGEFIARILCQTERCIFHEDLFYHRTTRKGSATNSNLFYTEKATNGFLLAAVNLKKFQQYPCLNEKQREFLNQPIDKFVLLTINSTLDWDFYQRLLSIVKKLNSLGFKKINLEGCKRKFRIFGKAYNLSPYLGALVLFLFPKVNSLYQYFISRKKK